MSLFRPKHFLLLLLLYVPLSHADDASMAGTPFDLQGYIDGELKAGKKRIVVPPGRYRVTPHKRMHLRLENLEGIEIVADGVEMICTETTRAVTIDSCKNLTIRGMIIDYDPLPFTQGKIVKISDDGLIHEIDIFKGYPTQGKVAGKKYEIFRPDTRTLRYGSYHGCEVLRLSPEKLQVTKPKRWKGKAVEKVGDIIAIDCIHAPGGSIPHALSISKSSQVKIERVTIYASAVFGFIESECNGTVYDGCVVDRRPAATDLKKRASARIRSLNADAFHSYHAKKGPQYLRCKARFQGDDCIAINGEYHVVMEVTGKVMRVLARRSFHMEAGDPVELLSYNGERLPDAKVILIQPDHDASAEEKEFMLKQSMDVRLKSSMHKAYQVTLDRSVVLPKGSLVCSSNRMGNGFKIIDGNFGFTRSRGLLIQASQGEIRGNVLDFCWGETIKVEPEYWWLSAGCTSDVVIRDNVINNSHRAAISVSARGGNRKLSPAGAHRNITISDNKIENSPTPQIHVTSTDGVTITKNIIELPAGASPAQAIELKQCRNTKIEDNKLQPSQKK